MDVIVAASGEKSIQETLAILLGEGRIIVPATTLPELMNALVEQPVDVVILDEFLEGADCATTYDRLRSLLPDATCILLTLQADSQSAREMRAKGIYDIVSKPFDKDDLLASVTRALERSRLMARLAAAENAPPPTAGGETAPATPSNESWDVHRREILDSLRKILKAVTDLPEPESLYTRMLEAVVEIFSVNRATLLVHDADARQMRVSATIGLSSERLRHYRAAGWTSIIAWLRENEQMLDLDAQAAPFPSKKTIGIARELELLQSRVCVPLVAEGRLIGALAVGRKITGKRFSDAESEFLCLLSQQIAAIIESARHRRDVYVQKQKFEEILQGVSSGLFATDAEGRVLVFNKAAELILRLSASEVVGKSVQRIGSVFADIMLRSLREEKSLCRHEVVDPATKTPLGISTSLLTGPDGRSIGAVALFTDLTTIAERDAATTDKAWQRCALRLAHEIKNPLVPIRTFAQLFPESYNDEKFRDEFSAIAIKEIDRLDGVVERLLRFAQPLKPKSRPDDINSLLEEEIEKMADEAKSRDVELRKSFALENGGTPFDRELMREAIAQILRNALDAMPSGGTLSVSTSRAIYPDPKSPLSQDGIPPGNVAEILIADTGAGIPPEEMPDLFEPFHTSKLKGMGLGLPISRRIIKEHSGDIVVSSEPDKGTTVRIILPHGATENGQDPGGG